MTPARLLSVMFVSSAIVLGRQECSAAETQKLPAYAITLQVNLACLTSYSTPYSVPALQELGPGSETQRLFDTDAALLGGHLRVRSPKDSLVPTTPVRQALEGLTFLVIPAAVVLPTLKGSDAAANAQYRQGMRAVALPVSVTTHDFFRQESVNDTLTEILADLAPREVLTTGSYRLIGYIEHVPPPLGDESQQAFGLWSSPVDIVVGPPRDRDELMFQAYRNASSALDDGRLDEAETQARRLLALDAVSEVPHDLLGQILEAKGDLPGAISEFQSVVTALDAGKARFCILAGGDSMSPWPPANAFRDKSTELRARLAASPPP